jgi:hypothetical protein
METMSSSFSEVSAFNRLAGVLMLVAVAFLSTTTTADEETLPSAIDADSVPLFLNGFATRKMLFIVDVYVGALYVERKSNDAGQLLKGDQHRIMQFDMLRDVRGRRIVNAFYEGMQLNVSPERIRKLEPEIKSVISMFDQKLKEGETAVLEYIPSVGTRVTLAGREKGVIPGKDLFDAILSIWIGENPVSKNFKDQILGRNS